MMASDTSIGYQDLYEVEVPNSLQDLYEVEVPEKMMVDLQLKLPKDAIQNGNRECPTYFLPGITKKVMSLVCDYCSRPDKEFFINVDPLTLFDLIQVVYIYMMASDTSIGYQDLCEVEVPEKMMVDLQLKLPKDAIRNRSNRECPTYFLPGITKKVMSLVLDYCSRPDNEFFINVDPLTLFDLIQAAHHFQNKSLMDVTCQTLVSMVKGKSPTEIKTEFISTQDYHWINNKKLSERTQSSPCPCRITRMREKETFIKPSNFVYVQRSHLATEVLNYIKRRKLFFDFCVVKLFEYQSDEDLLATARALSSRIKDQVLADRLKHDHVVLLFELLEKHTQRQDIQSVVVGILSCVNFIAHENAVTTARIQLLVKVIDVKGCNNYNYARTHQAVLTLTNIAKALPKFIRDILKSGALERVKRVLLVRYTGVMIDRIAMFLAAVCRTGGLSHLDKVDALTTLEMIFDARVFSEHHLEQACYTFQYLTYEKELQIKEIALMNLIGMLIGIIHKPPRDDCRFPGYALAVIGNIAIWGSSDQIKIFTSDSEILESLGMVMMAGSKKIKMEACQIISNIAARTHGLIEEMHKARLIEPLCRLLERDESLEKDECDVKMEAAWAIYNGIYGSEFSPSLTLAFRFGEMMRKVLESPDPDLPVDLPVDVYLDEDEDLEAGFDFEADEDLEDDDEDWIQKQSNPMVEIFGIIYLGQDDVEPRNQLGRINMYSLDIYNVDKVDETRKTIKLGDEFDIRDIKGPFHFHDNCNGLQFDLFCGAYKGRIYELFKPWQFISRDDAFLKKITLESIDGTEEVVIITGLYAHATIAQVELRLDTPVAANLYGGVAASNSVLDSNMATSFLFLEEQHKGITVGTDGLIPLSRSRVAVPYDAVLYLDIALFVDAQLLHTAKTFSARKTGVTTKKFKNLSITVKWDALYCDSNKEVNKQAGKKSDTMDLD